MRILGLLLAAWLIAGAAPAHAASTLVGTWTCYPLKGGHAPADRSSATFTPDGKMIARGSGDDALTARYRIAGGMLIQTIQGETIKTKLVWKGPNTIDLIASDPDMESKHCTRGH